MVRSSTEWKALLMLDCPKVASGAPGAKYVVHKVGFLALSPAQCSDADLKKLPLQGGKCLLPTVEIELGGLRRRCRLPLDLNDWALTTVALVRQTGRSPFPQQVEFGILDGRHYAEIL